VAIEKCHSAGIQVRMITGDHAVTAAAIGHQLGIEGKALTGAEFAAKSDEELLKELPRSALWRASPRRTKSAWCICCSRRRTSSP